MIIKKKFAIILLMHLTDEELVLIFRAFDFKNIYNNGSKRWVILLKKGLGLFFVICVSMNNIYSWIYISYFIVGRLYHNVKNSPK